jgi:hypothetical protein
MEGPVTGTATDNFGGKYTFSYEFHFKKPAPLPGSGVVVDTFKLTGTGAADGLSTFFTARATFDSASNFTGVEILEQSGQPLDAIRCEQADAPRQHARPGLGRPASLACCSPAPSLRSPPCRPLRSYGVRHSRASACMPTIPLIEMLSITRWQECSRRPGSQERSNERSSAVWDAGSTSIWQTWDACCGSIRAIHSTTTHMRRLPFADQWLRGISGGRHWSSTRPFSPP